jgi:hypothetical protein
MISRGCVVGEEYEDRISAHANELFATIPVEKKTRNVVSVLDYTKDKANEHIGELYGIFDEFYFGGSRKDFQAYEWLKEREIKPALCAHILIAIEEMLREFKEVVAARKAPWRSEDEQQLFDAYEHIAPRKISGAIKFLNAILADVERWGENKKATRAPRKKKKVTATKQLSSLKYQKECSELKITSVNPAKLLGAQQAWMYNTRYNSLTIYKASGPKGFTIKGTTLQGFAEDASETKKIRKPKEILDKVLSGGKIVLRRLMAEINTKSSVPTGRINENVILLRTMP